MPRRSECDIDSMHELLQEPVHDPQEKPKSKPTGLVQLGESVKQIGVLLDALPNDEQRCRVLAQACLAFEYYDLAERFIARARELARG